MNMAKQFINIMASYTPNEDGYRGVEYERYIRQFHCQRFVDGRFKYNSIDSTEIVIFGDGSFLRMSNPHEVEYPAYWEEIQPNEASLGEFIVGYTKDGEVYY